MANSLKLDNAFLERLERLNILAKRFLTARGPGKRETRNRGASIEFRDYRPYSRGDEVRYLDWNVYARHDELFVKEFSAEENVHVAILLDASRSMESGEPTKFEVARALAVSLGYIGLVNFDTVSLWAFSDHVQPVRSFLVGRTRVHDLIRASEKLTPEGPTDLRRAFQKPLPRLKGRSVVIVISDLYDQDGFPDAMLRLLGQNIQVDLLHVLSQHDLEPPLSGRLLMRDAESGRERELTVTPRVAERYRERMGKFLSDVEQYAQRHEIRYTRVMTNEPLEVMIVRLAQAGLLETA